MQVRVGWSGETEPSQWKKCDVTVDEGDLARVLAGAELPPELAGKLPTKLVFHLMQNEAEILLLMRLIGQGYPADKANARMAVLSGVTGNILEQVKKQMVHGDQ